jgi:wyosine [tRNA(Phe)-imidazoG37] synthetase (radical SAM superfamily)
VLSQRARGISLGINLNPDQHCSFACVYCEVNRDRPGRAKQLDLKVMTAELTTMLGRVYENRMREIPWFRKLPPELLELKEVALSGDGEPTLCPIFSKVVKAVTRVRERGLHPFKIVLITNTTGLHTPEVQRGLKLLSSWDEVWAKLDAGTQKYMTKVNRPEITLQQVLENILTVARTRPVVIQSLFPEHPPVRLTRTEIDQYVCRLLELKNAGAQISLGQVYSAHRPAHRPECTHLPSRILCDIVRRVRKVTGLREEVF